MKIIDQNALNAHQKKQIYNLWNNEYPKKLTYTKIEEFEYYLSNLTQIRHYLLFDEYEDIQGWALIFQRENEKWFVIIISEKLHGKGIGTKMLDELKKSESELNGWVIDHNFDKRLNGDIYKSPLEFYRKNNFDVFSKTRLELEVMSAIKIKWKK